MTNVKYNRRPFDGTWNNIVDDIFTELPVFFKNEFNINGAKGFVPVNVKETEQGYQMEVVAPGFDKEDFKLNLDDKILTISAEKKTETKDVKEKQIRNEYQYRSFKRTFTMDEKVDATNIEATYINGVLILNLPKREEVKVSATEIKIK